MKQLLTYVFAVLILGGGTALLVNQFMFKEEPDYARVIIIVLVMGRYLYEIIRVRLTNKDTVKQVNESVYPDIIKTAFCSKPENYDRLMKGIEYYNRNHYRKAVEVLCDLLQECRSEDDFFAVKYFLGLIYIEQEQYEKAVSIYEEVLEIDSEHSGANNNIGVAYNNMECYDEAKPYLKKSLELDSDQLETKQSLALAEYMTGNKERAIELIDNILEIYPDHRETKKLRKIFLQGM